MKKKGLILVLAVILLLASVGTGTLAWLTAKSDTVTNTFTTSDISIVLEETKGTGTGNNKEFKMIPGCEIEKDPKVWVETGSEDCYLFVKVDVAGNTCGTGESVVNFLNYTIDSGWTQLVDENKANVNGVYYRKVTSQEMGTGHKFSVLSGDKVTVSGNVTKEMMKAIETKTIANPTITITAYASQLHSTNNVEFEPIAAWRNLPTA